MSVSIHIKGIQTPDAKYAQMKAVYDACKAAKVGVPDSVREYFDYQEPSEFGVYVDLDLSEAVSSYQDQNGDYDGFEVELKKLPPNITHLRFYTSW